MNLNIILGWLMAIAYAIMIMMFLIGFPYVFWNRKKREKQFKTTINQFLDKDENLNLRDIISMREALDINEYQSRQIIKALYFDINNDEINKNQQITLEKIRLLQDAIEKEEPFEGCPNELKPSLIEIREIIKKHKPDNSELLLPLVKDLKEFNKMSQEYSKIKWQNKIAFWITICGFILSVIGLLYTITATPSSDAIAKSVMQQLNSNK